MLYSARPEREMRANMCTYLLERTCEASTAFNRHTYHAISGDFFLTALDTCHSHDGDRPDQIMKHNTGGTDETLLRDIFLVVLLALVRFGRSEGVDQSISNGPPVQTTVSYLISADASEPV